MKHLILFQQMKSLILFRRMGPLILPASMVLCCILSSCSKKDAVARYVPTDPIGGIDLWIADSLHRYYYWSDEIPADPDYSLSPDRFFGSLLSKSDRFSWVSNGVDVLAPSNSYFTYGFHYAFVQVDGYDGLIGVITAVNSGGPADRAGLRRGSYFLAVNGLSLDTGNLAVLNLALRTPGMLGLASGQYNDGVWTAGPLIQLSSGYAGEDPVQIVRVFEAQGIRTGYLYYNSFNEYYDDRVLDAVRQLQSAGVNELVLDLRYNAGGNVSSSAKLAGLIAGTLTASETYVIYQGNRFEGRQPKSLQSVLNTSGNASGREYTELAASRLSIQRVFILTTGGTVSAAELIINNLRPFLQVVQIGETTRGKNEAGFVIADNRNPVQVSWTMEPTVYKLFNKNNEGNYERGLAPQYAVQELSRLPLADIGDINDLLLNEALQLIYGDELPGTYTDIGFGGHTDGNPGWRSGPGSVEYSGRHSDGGLTARLVYHSVNEVRGACLLTNH